MSETTGKGSGIVKIWDSPDGAQEIAFNSKGEHLSVSLDYGRQQIHLSARGLFQMLDNYDALTTASKNAVEAIRSLNVEDKESVDMCYLAGINLEKALGGEEEIK